MTRSLVNLTWLTLVWLALWESASPANLATGLAVAVLIARLVPLRQSAYRTTVQPLAALRLLGVFLWELTKASVQVAWEVATPGDRTAPAVVSVPLETKVPSLVTMVANMVSLTPGTLTVDVDPDTCTLYVHVLHHVSDASTRAGVHRFELLATSAFPIREDSM